MLPLRTAARASALGDLLLLPPVLAGTFHLRPPSPTLLFLSSVKCQTGAADILPAVESGILPPSPSPEFSSVVATRTAIPPRPTPGSTAQSGGSVLMHPAQGPNWAGLDHTTRRQPPKSEFRGPKPERRPNTEGRSHARAFRISGFGLLSALGFRASGLGLCAHGLVVLSRYARPNFRPDFRLAFRGLRLNMSL